MTQIRDLSQPTTPDDAVQRLMAQETEERRATAAPPEALGESQGADAALRERLGAAVAALRGEILELSHDVHDHPEVGYTEHHAMAAVASLLERHGIDSEQGVYGMDTALRTQVGSTADDAPTIAILCEYDALPGIGHGCGHNVMCANSVGAFLALAELEKAAPGTLPGRVVLQTTPAEENDTAKERLALAGMLDGVDAAIQTHSYARDVVHQTWLGQRRLRAVFTGVPAHASSQPFMGRNALDTATLTLTGIGLLRQQILPGDRLHGIISDGGQVPNVIPERTELSFFIRSKHLETLKDLVGRVEDVLRGAALMTGTGLEILAPDYANEMPVRANGPLSAAWTRSQRERGRDPLPFGVLSETVAAGTDFGNVSQRIPGIHPLIGVTSGPDVALHTREMTAAAGSATGDRAAVDGAYGLAVVALDWLVDPELRDAVRADFEASGGVVGVAGFWED